MDAVAEAGSLGIGADRSVTFENDSQGIELNYEVVGRTLCQMRACAPSAAPMGAEWKEDIEEDYNKRKKGLFGRKK